MKPESKLREFWNLFFRDARAGAETLCMHLLPRQQLRLNDAAGWVLESCGGGTLWITQEGDARDVMLKVGERFTLDRDGKTLVSGLGEAILAVRPPAGARGRRDLRIVPLAAPHDGSARAAWLNALYPEPAWNDPTSLRRAGLL